MISNYNVWVEEGEDIKIAEFYLNNIDDSMVDLFDSVNFYDINKEYENKNNKDYWFKYGVDSLVYECIDDLEGEVCNGVSMDDYSYLITVGITCVINC